MPRENGINATIISVAASRASTQTRGQNAVLNVSVLCIVVHHMYA